MMCRDTFQGILRGSPPPRPVLAAPRPITSGETVWTAYCFINLATCDCATDSCERKVPLILENAEACTVTLTRTTGDKVPSEVVKMHRNSTFDVIYKSW